MTEREELLQLRARVAELERASKLRDKLERIQKKQLENLELSGHMIADPDTDVYYDVDSLEGLALKKHKLFANYTPMDLDDVLEDFENYSRKQETSDRAATWKNMSKIDRYKSYVNSELFLSKDYYRLNNIVNMIETAGRGQQMAECVRQAGGDANRWQSYILDNTKVESDATCRGVNVEVNGHIIVIQIDQTMYDTSGAGIEIYLEA